MSPVGKLTADFIAIINFGSRESRLQSTQHEPRSHGDAQNKQPTIPRVHIILICFICFNIWGGESNDASPKIGPQIAAKVGNPAGLLCRRIWYSVGKSWVLGITEYRQGRPLILMVHWQQHTITIWHHP